MKNKALGMAYFCPKCGEEYLLTHMDGGWLCRTCGETLKMLKLPYTVLRRRRNEQRLQS